jgi:GT2 family glycosyltransferase
VILFCRNAERTLRRSIESVAQQSYKKIEYVVQDAASADGTLDIIRGYQDHLDIKLVSEPDAGPADGFWRALKRCRGEIVATCLADEELLPDAVQHAVSVFRELPYIGAITGDAFVIDADGRTLGIHKSEPFSFTRYLAAEYCPYWCSSFFSMRALRSVGLFDRRWSADSLEFEVWCRLAEDYEILYVPKILSKYGVHPEQLSNQGERALTELRSRLQIIREHVFRPEGVFGALAHWRDRCILLQKINLLQHLLAYRVPAAESLEADILANHALPRRAVLQRAASRNEVQRNIRNELYGNPLVRGYHTAVATMYRHLLPASVRGRLTPNQKAWLRRVFRLPRAV